jgi:hypothetical protein
MDPVPEAAARPPEVAGMSGEGREVGGDEETDGVTGLPELPDPTEKAVDPVPEAAARGAEEEGDSVAEGEGGGAAAEMRREERRRFWMWASVGAERKTGCGRRDFGRRWEPDVGVAILGLPESRIRDQIRGRPFRSQISIRPRNTVGTSNLGPFSGI